MRGYICQQPSGVHRVECSAILRLDPHMGHQWCPMAAGVGGRVGRALEHPARRFRTRSHQAVRMPRVGWSIVIKEGTEYMSGAPVEPVPAALRGTTPVLDVRWPWWLHPAWALVLMVGTTAVVSVTLPPQFYRIWGTTKFLDSTLSAQLILGILLVFIGILIANYRNARGGHVKIVFAPSQLAHLRKAYWVILGLTLLGYVFWCAVAITEGVRVSDLLAVVQRDAGAIGQLKANSRPIGGLTTLTQLGPVAVILGFVRRRLGVGGRSYWVVVALSIVRATFYAERLALLEVLLPLVLVATITMNERSRWRPLAQVIPLLLGPLVWVVFAISEYSRSWIYYQQVVSMPFNQWVTSRLLGYYTTSYNNSALFSNAWRQVYEPPYMSIQAFWNAPGVDFFFDRPSIFGLEPNEWWSALLQAKSNPEFNNTGSFLVAYAEMGWVVASLFWLLIGCILGLLFSSITRGSFIGLVAYCSVFIGILELPRFIYWTQGRAVPILAVLLVLAWTYQHRNKFHKAESDKKIQQSLVRES